MKRGLKIALRCVQSPCASNDTGEIWGQPARFQLRVVWAMLCWLPFCGMRRRRGVEKASERARKRERERERWEGDLPLAHPCVPVTYRFIWILFIAFFFLKKILQKGRTLWLCPTFYCDPLLLALHRILGLFIYLFWVTECASDSLASTSQVSQMSCGRCLHPTPPIFLGVQLNRSLPASAMFTCHLLNASIISVFF